MMCRKVRVVEQTNTLIRLHNKELENKNNDLKLTSIDLTKEVENLNLQKESLISQKDQLANEINFYNTLLTQEQEKFNNYKNSLQEQMDLSAEKMSNDYFQAEEECQNEYKQILIDYSSSMQKIINEKTFEMKEIEACLEDLKNKTSAAIENYKREQEKKEKRNFYKLQLSTEDIEEIQKLKSVSKFLRNSEPLNKVIWKVYYENPFTDLCGRVVGKQQRTGIYKITNIENNMCYIGQAKDIGARWLQHCKKGMGADTPTKNKLYPAMLQYGIENFTFEIVEDCVLDKLGEREKFWQEYFKAKEYGYSIK